MSEAVPVQLLLRTLIQPDNERMQLSAAGTLTREQDMYVLRYQENLEDEERQVTLRMREGSVTIETEGSFSSLMLFETGRRFETFYQTPWGKLNMGVFPSLVETELALEKGRAHLIYQLDFDGGSSAQHDLMLRYRRREKE